VKVSERGVSEVSHPLPVTMECQNCCGSSTEPVNIDRYAAPTLSKVTLSAWPIPSPEEKICRQASRMGADVKMMTNAPTIRPSITAKTVTMVGLVAV
jgi:hypothetical protein